MVKLRVVTTKKKKGATGIHLVDPSKRQIADAKERAEAQGFSVVWVHKTKEKQYQARIKYPAHFSKRDFFGSWHPVKGSSVEDVKRQILKGTVGLNKKRIQVRKKRK